MSFKYTVPCNTLPLVGYDIYEQPTEILEAIKDAGYDGADLIWDPERADARELRQIADSIGLKMLELMPNWGGEGKDLACTDEETRKEGIELAKKGIDFAVDLGAPLFGYCLPQPSVAQIPFPEVPIETLRKNLVYSLREICAYAAERDITVVIEPLNCYESYPRVANTVHLTINLITELCFSNVGIQPDVFHMNIGEASIPAALRAAGKLVKHVHINETDHYNLGTGHADIKAVVRTLREINYTGYLAIYLPFTTQAITKMASIGGGTAGRPDLKTYLEAPLRYMKQLESVVDLQREIYEMDEPYL